MPAYFTTSSHSLDVYEIRIWPCVYTQQPHCCICVCAESGLFFVAMRSMQFPFEPLPRRHAMLVHAPGLHGTRSTVTSFFLLWLGWAPLLQTGAGPADEAGHTHGFY
jgi:hypothetical protein